MAHRFRISRALANAEAAAAAVRFMGGYLRIYAGDQPEDPDTEIVDQQPLVEMRFASPAMGPVKDGSIVALADLVGIADRKGQARWYRAFQSDGVVPIADGTVGTSHCDINLKSIDIDAGGTVTVAGYTYTRNRG